MYRYPMAGEVCAAHLVDDHGILRADPGREGFAATTMETYQCGRNIIGLKLGTEWCGRIAAD